MVARRQLDGDLHRLAVTSGIPVATSSLARGVFPERHDLGLGVVPAALGVGKADPDHRPVVVVGDGAFVMTGLEAAACAFNGVPAIIIVLDNSGYGTQRPIMDGPFNDIPAIAVEKLPEAFGTGRGFAVTTRAELENALRQAVASDELCIIRVQLPKDGRSAALQRLGEALRARA